MATVASPPIQQCSHTNSMFSPLLISTLGIAAVSTTVVLYHMLIIRCCVRRRGRHAAESPSPAAAAVDENVLKAIPILTFSAVKRGNADVDDECAVCLGELEDDDQIRLVPSCGHAFHVPCIDRWFAARASCPLCRSPVIEPARSDPSVGARITDREGGGEEARSRLSGLLRHWSASLAEENPAEGGPSPSHSPETLNRSLSMDPSLVEIGRRSADCSGPWSNLRHLDRVSSRLRRSFSRLCVRKAGRSTILPY